MSKILMMAMSLRKDSFNKKLILNSARILREANTGHDIDVQLFNDYPMPVYDWDLETQQGIPESVRRLGQKIVDANAIIFSSPEYNGGIAGPFKNTIDWVSRIDPMPWPGKNILLLGASDGALGAIRGLGHSRVPLGNIGVFVYPEMFGLPRANLAFDEADKLKDPAIEARLSRLLFKFRDFVDK